MPEHSENRSGDHLGGAEGGGWPALAAEVVGMNEPDPAVLAAIAQLAEGLPHVDAEQAWARLADLTPQQRAAVERVVGDLAAVIGEHRPRSG